MTVAWVDKTTFGMVPPLDDDKQLDSFYLAFYCLRQAIKHTASNANDLVYPTATFKKKYKYDTNTRDSQGEV